MVSVQNHSGLIARAARNRYLLCLLSIDCHPYRRELARPRETTHCMRIILFPHFTAILVHRYPLPFVIIPIFSLRTNIVVSRTDKYPSPLAIEDTLVQASTLKKCLGYSRLVINQGNLNADFFSMKNRKYFSRRTCLLKDIIYLK